MSIGSSGRIVIEVEPETKRQLYGALAQNGLTLKEWFLEMAALYMCQSELGGTKTITEESASLKDSKRHT